MSEIADRLVRQRLRNHEPYKPGTTVDAVRRKYGLERIVKLSSNENPLGTSPRALEALRGISSLNIYLDDDLTELRQKIAAPHALGAENVFLGHGSNEVLVNLYSAFVEPGEDVVMAAPTFSLFGKDALVAGASAIEVPLREGVHDLRAMAAAVTPKTKLVFVCDPNNPTGTRVEREEWERFVRAVPERVLIVLDQAYREFMDEAGVDGVEWVTQRETLVVLRTVSKIYGLASVRFGYGLASKEIVSWLERVRLPFNVARPAALAVWAALDDREFLERSVANNEEGKRFLYGEFRRLGLFAYPTAANFVAVRVPVSSEEAYQALMERGIIVRSGDGLRMPNFLRVSIGTPAENSAFIGALEMLLTQWTRRAGFPGAPAR